MISFFRKSILVSMFNRVFVFFSVLALPIIGISMLAGHIESPKAIIVAAFIILYNSIILSRAFANIDQCFHDGHKTPFAYKYLDRDATGRLCFHDCIMLQDLDKIKANSTWDCISVDLEAMKEK